MRFFLDQDLVVDDEMPRGVIDYEETVSFDLIAIHPETRQALFDAEVYGAVIAQLVDQPYGRHPLPAFAHEALAAASDTYLALGALPVLDASVVATHEATWAGCVQPGCLQDVTSTHRGFGLCAIHEADLAEIDALLDVGIDVTL